MTRRELTSEERAVLSEDELIEHDLQFPRVRVGMEDATRALIRGRIRRERADAAIRKLAAEADTTPAAIRKARAEQEAVDREKRAARDLATARDAVKVSGRPGRPRGRMHPKAAIVTRYRELKAANDGKRPTQGELARNLSPDIGVSTLREYLTEYGLPWPIE